MFDLDPVPMQRSLGEARVSFASGRLAGLRQAGSAKALLPATFDAVPELVFLNTSGGLTDGDRLSYGVDLGERSEVLATTQTAERAYRSRGGAAEVSVDLSLGPGARLDWLPQETILFDAAHLNRRTRVDLAGDAACLLLEPVVLGRAAMGETVARLAFRDRREIRRGGRLVWLDPFDLSAGILAKAGRGALLGGARAFATLIFCAPGAETAVEAARAVLDEPATEGAASGFDGKCIVRLLAADGWPLRRQIVRLLERLRPGRALPRVWQI